MRLAVVGELLVGLAACGARTELFERGATTHDAGLLDTSIDVVRDMGVEAPPTHVECTATSTTALAVDPNWLDQLAVDDAYVYFHTRDGISRVLKSGGAVETVATFTFPGWPDWSAFVLGDTNLVWPVYVGNTVNLMVGPKQGGAPSTITTQTASTPYYGFGQAPLGDFYLWGVSDLNTTLLRVTLQGVVTGAGGVPNSATDSVGDSDGVRYAAAELGIFKLEQDNVFHLFARAPIGAGSVVFTGFLQFDATSIYFWSGNDAGENDIVSVSKAGGPISILAQSTEMSTAFA